MNSEFSDRSCADDWVPLPNSIRFGIDSVPFPIKVQSLTIGDREIENPALMALYDSSLNLIVNYEQEGDLAKIFEEMESEAYLQIKTTVAKVKLLIIQRSFGDDVMVRYSMMPQSTPCPVFDTSVPPVKLVISVVNGPPLFFQPSELVFRHGDFRISLIEYEHVKENREKCRDLGGQTALTGEISISKPEGETACGAEFEAIARCFLMFLNFVRGANVAIGNTVGFDREGRICFANLGFSKSDPIEVPDNWCSIGVTRELPEIYEKFQVSAASERDGEVLRNCISFYRASNAIRATSFEMAIVASHAALETIVPHILSTRAGWSEELLAGRSSFHSKLRACAGFVGLSRDPLEHAPKLAVKSASLNNADGYELSSLYRNRIVHQGKSFTYTGHELLEIWELQQWLVEVFIFFLIDYRGIMNDRRRYSGWRGPEVPIPLS